MISPGHFVRELRGHGIQLFAGVPDSLLASLCAYIDDHAAPGEHLITANEGNAVAVAAGYHLATGRTAAVYLQNSGLGNTVNPLTSILDADVYRVPLLLIVGWRGEPGVHDEPQHVKQGRISRQQLEVLDVPHWVVDATTDPAAVIRAAVEELRRRGSPVALLVRQGSFADYTRRKREDGGATLGREEALQEILALCDPRDLVVATTGKTSREVFSIRQQRGEPMRDFLTVGGMGHTASIALGVALGAPTRRVMCLDGDGSLLMHLGAVPVIGDVAPRNLVHVLLNNAAHESVGGQRTVAGCVDFAAIARACGYLGYLCAASREEIRAAWPGLAAQPGPVLFEIKIKVGSRKDLGRPTSLPQENKAAFMKFAGVA